MLASNTTDWLAAIGTVVGALLTFGAVAIALYQSVFRDIRKAPKLTIRTGTYSWGGPDDTPIAVRLSVTNARGKRTAQDVEILATAGPEGRGAVYILRGRALVWDEGPLKALGEGRTRVTIPANATRQIAVGFLGGPPTVWEALPPHRPPTGEFEVGSSGEERCGVWATFPLTQDKAEPLYVGRFHFRLVVTARDIDAVAYAGRLDFAIRKQGTWYTANLWELERVPHQ